MALSTQRASSPSSPSSSIPPSSHEVFLSFRGEDTRYGFVDHLHKAFQQRGIIVFKDDKKLEQGSTIAEELYKAIKESQYAVVVISKTFAESKWCLNELIEILRCKRETGLKVIPIFYHVDPADVRKQKGIFAKAFAKHQEDPEVDGEKMGTWGAALKEVADTAGTHVSHNSPEATIVEQLTTEIFGGLHSNPSEIFKDLVGIKSRVEKVKSLLCLQMDDVRFIGIHGMGGIGKTTLARALYNCVCCEFDASSFLCCGEDKGSSLEKLQQQIFHEILKENNRKIYNHLEGVEELSQRLCNKKVFIVFDDVNRDQLNVLAKSPRWFGKGSRIVVTGRDSQLWKPIITERDIYEVDPLEPKDALELFCRKASNRSYRENDFAQLSMCLTRSVGYLPLGLEVIGSLLCDEPIEVWECTLNDLQCLEGDVFSKLKVGYNGLTEIQKEMFLDIACFFTGAIKQNVLPIFESLGYNPLVNFKVLEKKSFIKIMKDGMIWMHYLLREMGHWIVNQLSPTEPGNRSRLWSGQEILHTIHLIFGDKRIWMHGFLKEMHQQIVNELCSMEHGNRNRLRCEQEIIHVIQNCSGTSAIRGIVLYDFLTSKPKELNCEAFSQMKNLRMLILGRRNTNITWVGNHSNLMLGNELRILVLPNFPLKSLPKSFQSNNLVELSLQHSKIKVLWHGNRTFNRLKSIDLSSSKDLTTIPDLSEAPSLVELKFRRCTSLKRIHPSVATLKQLLRLDLLGCQSLESLPRKIYWKSLTYLDLSTCIKLENFSKNFHNWLSSFMFLKRLNLSFCRLLDVDFLSDVSSLSSLQVLHLDGNNFTKVPDSFYLLPQLVSLHMNNCWQLQVLPKLPFSLFDLQVKNSRLQEVNLSEMEEWARVWISVANGTPYKILQVNLRKYTSNGWQEKKFVWGPTLGCEVPDWFNHKSANFFWGDEKLVGIALLVAYQDGERENSNYSTSRGSNSTSLGFACQFQAVKPMTRLRLVCRVPEVPLDGLNGFWAFIPAEVFNRPGMYLFSRHFFETSIESSWNGEATEWKSRLVFEEDVSEFFGVLNSISPKGLKLKNLKDFSLKVAAGNCETENQFLRRSENYIKNVRGSTQWVNAGSLTQNAVLASTQSTHPAPTLRERRPTSRKSRTSIERL